MATHVTISNITGINQVGNSYQRKSAVPLDYFSLFNSKDAAELYAKENPVAYVGQLIAVVDSNNKVTHYSIEDEAGTLKAIGFQTENSIIFVYKGVAQELISDTELKVDETTTVTASSNNIGWVYFCDGVEYASDGQKWESFGGPIDLSNYLTKTEASNIYATIETVGSGSGIDSGAEGTDFNDLNLTQRINRLKAHFETYYTKNQTDEVISTAITQSYTSDAFKTAAANAIIWENIPSETTN